MSIFSDYRLSRIERALYGIARKLDVSIQLENEEMATLADIQAQADDTLARVTANTDALAGIKTLLDSQNAQIKTLTDELNAAIANGADPAVLQAISDKLTAVTTATDTQAAAEAALANTPAA